MSQARDIVLDHACEHLAEIRAEKNSLATQEKHEIGVALQRMQQRGTTAYKHAGVELARIPGADALRVRLTKDDGDAAVEGGTTTSTNPGHHVGGDTSAPAPDDAFDSDELSVQ